MPKKAVFMISALLLLEIAVSCMHNVLLDMHALTGQSRSPGSDILSEPAVESQ